MDIHASTKDADSHKHRWEVLNNDKTNLMSRCEQYAAWTLPYVFPPENHEDMPLPVDNDSIGARGVNHLSNKIISTLFPAKSLFFRLVIDQEMRDLLETAVQQANNTADAESIRSMLATAVQAAEQELLKAEKRAEERLNMVLYRPQATNAIRLLIVTGNALVFHPEGKEPVQVYSLRNYCVRRDVSGTPVEMMTRETKAFETFHPEVQQKLMANEAFKAAYNNNKAKKDYNDDTDVTIYTRILLHDDGKYHVTQYADEIDLGTKKTYTRKSLRWIPLTWNLMQGEDYGRGLVADYAGAFHAVNVLSVSLLNIGALLGDIKIFINPQSNIDLVELTNSQAGSYHYGKPDDVGTGDLRAIGSNAQFIQAMIERYEQQISAAFLLASAMQRNAERVTTEEIRRDMDELESSNAGVYARLAADWQQPTAYIALEDTDFEGVGDGIEPKVITGMDSLSRAGEAYNLRLFLGDLALLNSVPEDVRAGIKKPQFISQVATYHTVPVESWIMTEAEMQAAAQAEAQAQAALQQQQQEGQMQQTAMQAAAEGE